MASLTQRKADALAREYANLLEVQASTKQRIEEIQEAFRSAYDLGPHLAGDMRVSIQRNVRRDDKAFMAEYPFESYPDFYKPTIDSTTVNHELSKAVLEKFQIAGPNKVVITAIDDKAGK